MAPVTISPAPPQAGRVEVFRRPTVDDPEGTHALAAAQALGLSSISDLRLGRGYLLPPEFDETQVLRTVRELLADPVLDVARITAPGEMPAREGAAFVLVARKPGVTDPVSQTLERALHTAGIAPVTEEDLLVTTFQAWEMQTRPAEEHLSQLSKRVLANVVIDAVSIDDETLYYGRPAEAEGHGVVDVPLLKLDEAALVQLSNEGLLSLDAAEMLTIQEHFADQGREPTSCELETLAQTWSEHCQHKTFRGLIEMDGEVIDNLLKSTIAKATYELDKPWCISVFHDNAGIVEFDHVDGETWDLSMKVETHNHPSAIDPYGGAGTGIGGVVRDILGVGMGAKPIANLDAFFVGPPDLAPDQVPRGSMHPSRILRGVVAGVRDYGNRMGIPTVAGGVWFHEGYTANPLVYAGTVGLMPRWAATKEVRPGDVIVTVGGRTGRDGIHGATFSSVELHEDSETQSAGAVQIGDPITEKKVLDGLLAARDARLFRGLTDCGAGGLSSAVGEMGAECGAEVDLDLVPLKYPGLSPEEIWISEAQERMVLSVPPEDLKACIKIFDAEGATATAIGHFTDTGRLVLRYGGVVHADINMNFLHEGNPRQTRKATWSAPDLPTPAVPVLDDPGATLLELLKRPTLANKEWIIRQFDHEVQGQRVIGPTSGVRNDGPSDGVVLHPVPGSKKGAAIGLGANARYGRLDPRAMAETCIDEALRNVVAAGGDPTHTSLLDNFSWGNCNKPDRLGSLVHAAKGCYASAMALGTPFISGKDSLNNEYRVGDETIAIPPTLLISALSIVPDVTKAVTMDLKKAGNILMLVGETKNQLGGSELHALLGMDGGEVPRPDLRTSPDLFACLHAAMQASLVRTCHDLSEGGLGVALAESAMAGDLGATIQLSYAKDLNRTSALFSESTTRFLVEVAPHQVAPFQEALGSHPVTRLGEVQAASRLQISDMNGDSLVDLSIDSIRDAFNGSFQG